jgi:hypothetical protein
VDLSLSPIDFGLVNCGSAPVDKAVTFHNTGSAPLTYTMSLASGAYFTLKGTAAGTLAPGDAATVTLGAPSVPTTSTAGTAVTDTLHVTTNVTGSEAVDVPVTLTPQGGSLTVSPVPAGFGQIDVNVQAPDIPLVISNVGNAPVDLTFGAPTDGEFAIAYTGSPAAVTLAPNGTVPAAAARFKPTSTGDKTATSALQVTGALCASPASDVSFSGTGTYAAVTVAPSPLPFGSTPCGTSAAPQTVSITNGYPYAITYSYALGLGTSSPYAVSDPSAGKIAANSKATLTVTPKRITVPASITAGAFNDTLTITPVAPGITVTQVPLTQSAQGAILAVTMATTDFSTVQANATGSLPFSVKNTGNVDATLSATPGGSGFGASLTGGTTATANGGTRAGTATFTPPALGAANGSLLVSSTTAQCGPAPASIPLKASGAGPVASVPGTTVAFAVTCGGSASGTQTVAITNNGTAPLTLSKVTTKGRVKVVSAPASIAAGTSGNVVLQANAAVIGTDVGGMTYSDTLSISTNELGTPTHTVPLSVKVSGANLGFVDANGAALSQITITACGTGAFNYGVHNSGDLAATVTATSPGTQTGSGYATFSSLFSSGVSVAANSTVTDGFRARAYGLSAGPPSTCSGTDTYTYSTGPSDPVCQKPPAFPVHYDYTTDCGDTSCC